MPSAARQLHAVLFAVMVGWTSDVWGRAVRPASQEAVVLITEFADGRTTHPS